MSLGIGPGILATIAADEMMAATQVMTARAAIRFHSDPISRPSRGRRATGRNIGRVTYSCVSSFYNTTLSAVLSSVAAIIMFPKALSRQNGNRSKAWVRPS